MQARPGVSVQFDVRRLDNVVEEVASGATDIGLCLGFVTHPGIATETMRTDRMVAVMRAEHPLAALSILGPADLVSHDFVGIDLESQLGLAVRNAFNLTRVPYAPRAEVRYCHTAAVLAHASNGVAVVDPFTASFLPNMDLVARPFDPAIAIPSCLLTRKGRPLNRVAAEFRDAMLSALARLPATPPGHDAGTTGGR
jgi:DNA-binding transcriptional LysR family regulator